MVRCEAIQQFTLGDFDKLTNIKRRTEINNKHGELFVGDTFECDEKMANYLTGENSQKVVVAKVIEVIPEKVEEPKVEKTPIKIGKKKNKK